MSRHLAFTRQRARGFTLVELMVALALGLLLLTALIALVVSTVSNRAELDKSVQQIENGRYALQALGEDIEMAGFAGTLNPIAGNLNRNPDSDPDHPVPVRCPGASTSASDLGYRPLDASQQLPLALKALTGTDGDACLVDIKAGTKFGAATLSTQRLLLTRVSSVAQTAASVAGNTSETFIQVSACNKDVNGAGVRRLFAVAHGGDSSLTLRQKGVDDSCSGAADGSAPVRKVMQRIYFINQKTAADTPTLTVAEYVNGEMKNTPLVEGIEDMRFDFGQDTNDDGAPDTYVASPTDWSAVMTVRIHVLARSIEPSSAWAEEEKKRTYEMGLTGTAGPFDDGYKRSVYSTVVRLNNIAGLKEAP